MRKSALISSLVAAAIATASAASANEVKTVSLIEDPVDPSALAVCAQLAAAPKCGTVRWPIKSTRAPLRTATASA